MLETVLHLTAIASVVGMFMLQRNDERRVRKWYRSQRDYYRDCYHTLLAEVENGECVHTGREEAG